MLKAVWKIQVRKADTNELIKEIKLKNIITNNGKNFIASRYVASHNVLNAPTHWVLVLGTGSGTPSPDDTNLWSPVDASEKTGQLTSSGNIAQYWVRYLPEDANGYTYTEAGIYDGISDSDWNNSQVSPKYPKGTLINHVVISPSLEKTSDILVDFYIQIQFA